MRWAKAGADIAAQQLPHSLVIKYLLFTVDQGLELALVRHRQVAGLDLLFGADDSLAIGQLGIGEETGAAVVHLEDQTLADKTLVGEEKQQGIAVAGEVIDGDVVSQGITATGQIAEEGEVQSSKR